jgi:beta-glucanase (GH16 family)
MPTWTGTGTWPLRSGGLTRNGARRRYGGCGYTSARLITRDRVSLRYGLVQARMKIPRARGIWPALWMLGQDIGRAGWPGCGEIDVMEHCGTGPAAVHGTVHGPGYSGRGGISASHAVGPSLGRGFHVYSVSWDVGQIRWYVNDDLYHAVTRRRYKKSRRDDIGKV